MKTSNKNRNRPAPCCFLLILFLFISATASGQPGRENWQPPGIILDTLGVRPGMCIGEVGAGRGYMTFPLAAKTGPEGKVYANDISSSSLDYLRDRKEQENIHNLFVVEGEENDPMFPVKGLDMVIMVYVFHHLNNPAQYIMNTEKYLSGNGTLVILEKDIEKDPSAAGHFLPREELLGIMAKTNFSLLRTVTFLKNDNIYIFGKNKTTYSMKQLIVPRKRIMPEVFLSGARSIEESQAPCHALDQLNWPGYPYKPDVCFEISYWGNNIFLKYRVREKNIMALETKTNGRVYHDSCVEFFISFDGQNYYNFEFSCIGTTLLKYGPGRENRSLIEEEIIDQIDVRSSLGSQPFEEKTGDFYWELAAVIPASCFVYDEIARLEGIQARANFYKCGDGLSEPHYVTWNPVKTEQPDYHRPEFFGRIVFE